MYLYLMYSTWWYHSTQLQFASKQPPVHSSTELQGSGSSQANISGQLFSGCCHQMQVALSHSLTNVEYVSPSVENWFGHSFPYPNWVITWNASSNRILFRKTSGGIFSSAAQRRSSFRDKWGSGLVGSFPATFFWLKSS